MKRIFIALLALSVIVGVSCSNEPVTQPETAEKQPLLIKAEEPESEYEESDNENGDEPDINDDPVDIEGQQLIVKGEDLGITIGTPSSGKTTDAEGYPHRAIGYDIWGPTATHEDDDGKLIPFPPGMSVNAPLTILNGNDHARKFHLAVQSTGNLTSDKYGIFEPIPEEYHSWIGVEDWEPKVAIGGTKKLLVTLNIPYEFPLELKGGKYWFGILVEDWSQTGFVQLAPRMNWLITFTE